jgi:hypothetical protein
MEHPRHDCHFVCGTRLQPDVISLQIFAIALLQDSLRLQVFIDQHPLQRVSNHASKLKTHAREAARSRMNLHREFATFLSSHHSLNVLDDTGDHAAVVFKLLGAIRHFDASLRADELVVCSFIDVLKPSPPAYVID